MRSAGPQLERLRSQIETGERGGDDADRSILLEFDRRLSLVRQETGKRRALKLMRHTTRMAENVGGLGVALEDRGACEAIVGWIHETYENPETNRDYRAALRRFGDLLSDGDGPPPSIAWVSTSTPRSYDPAPDPSEMLGWADEVRPMIDATMNPRDAALIAVAFDAGPRPGELYDLELGSVSDGDYGLRVQVDGKKGERSVALIPSVPMLTRWIEEHPGLDDDGAPLWSKLGTPDQVSYKMMLKIFNEAADRAGVDKDVTPSVFRKSNATWLARNGATENDINRRQGRRPGSKMTARYVAMFGPDGEERRYAKLMGLDVEDDGDDAEQIAPLACPRCQRETPRDKERCVWCGQLVDYTEERSQREDEATIRQAVMRIAREDPSTLDDVERAQAMLELLDERPELLDEARAFLDELG